MKRCIGRVARLPHHSVNLKELWASFASAMLGLTLMVCILMGIGSHPIAMAAASVSVEAESSKPESLEAAVAAYLMSMPGDFHAIGSVSRLKTLIASQSPLLIDVRNRSEYEAGHIPTAINLPLNDLEQHLDAVPHDQDVIVYCSTGYRSAMAVMALQLQGFDRDKGFPPGFVAWKAAQSAQA